MSEENTSSVDSSESQVDNPELSKEQEDFVSRKAYEEVSNDMHKYKTKMRELAAHKNELEAKMKAAENEKLKEQERWKELYEKEKHERESLVNELQSSNEKTMRAVKKSALKQELGLNIKDAYLDFADIKGIEINEDGSVNSDTLLAIANKFREEHPELINNKANSKINDLAPGNKAPSESPIDIEKISEDKDALRKLLADAPVKGNRFKA